MQYLNRLEPNGLVEHFLKHPPNDFSPSIHPNGTVFFLTHFDLLTTLEPSLRARLSKWPFYRYWSARLKLLTCFIGTTVSEYMPLPPVVSVTQWVTWLRDHKVRHYPLVIIKDIPCQSPLLTDVENDYAAELMLACRDANFILLKGQALAWVKIDFDSTRAYLDRLSSSRRKNIRRKLKSRQSLTVQTLRSGDALFFDPEAVDEFYALYLNVYAQSEMKFDLLSRAFFASILQDPQLNGVIFVYRNQERMIAYNICFVEKHALVDKYLGLLYPEARQANIYAVSWFENLQYAIDHGLTRYIAGWTDPEVKSELGAEFTWTQHAVYIRNPLLRWILQPLSALFEGDHERLASRTPCIPPLMLQPMSQP